jgi:hypothetical protein
MSEQRQHCGTQDLTHQGDHEGWCCDCFDLHFGMALDLLNEERAEKGKPPLLPLSANTRGHDPGDEDVVR